MKYLIILLPLFIFSCKNKEVSQEDDLSKVKSIILDGYFKNDSIYLNSFKNCYFQYFIDKEFSNLEFDHFIDSIGIKYLICPYSNFNFVLLKCKSEYYYYGLSDFYAYRDFLEKRYVKNTNLFSNSEEYIEYVSSTGSLEIFDDINDKGINTLNNIINSTKWAEDAKEHSPYFFQKIYALIYYINHVKSRNIFVFNPVYENVNNSYDEELLKLMNVPNENDSIYKDLINKYKYLSKAYYPKKQSFFFKQEGLGIFIYDVSAENGVIDIKRKFIPEKKIPIIISHSCIPPNTDCSEYRN